MTPKWVRSGCQIHNTGKQKDLDSKRSLAKISSVECRYLDRDSNLLLSSMSSSIPITPNIFFEVFALRGYYAVSIDSYLPTLWGSLSVSLPRTTQSTVQHWPKKLKWTKQAVKWLEEGNWTTNFVQFEDYRLGCDAVPSLTEIHRRFKDICHLHHRVRGTLMIETTVSSGTSVNTTRLQRVTSKKTKIFRYSPWASFKPYVRIPQGSNVSIRSGFLSIFPEAAHQLTEIKQNTNHTTGWKRLGGLNIGQLVLSETADRAEVVMLSTIWQQLRGKENTTSRVQANITSTDIVR